MKKTALIILNYNNVDDSVTCIESVERFNTAPVKYILVDNASTREGVVDALDAKMSQRFNSEYLKLTDNDAAPMRLPRFTFLASSVNDGYAAGNNKGLRLAYADDEIDRVMILNSDIVFVEDIIPNLVAAAEKLPDCGIISPTLYKKGLKEIDYNCARSREELKDVINYNISSLLRLNSKSVVRRQILRRFDIKSLNSVIPIDLPSGSCMLMDKDLMKKIGSFDDKTFLYNEENILFEKLNKRNLTSYLLPSCKCIHLGATSTSKSPSSFILKKGCESQKYYVYTYLKPNLLKKTVYLFTYYLCLLKINLGKILRNK